MTPSRLARTGAVFVAMLVAVTLVGACESGVSDREQADIAAQDRAVANANKIEAQNRAKLKAALRKSWLQRARARQAARRQRARIIIRTPAVVDASRSNVGDICAPIRSRRPGAAGRAERQARRLLRKQALGYLNLSCPSLNMPKI